MPRIIRKHQLAGFKLDGINSWIEVIVWEHDNFPKVSIRYKLEFTIYPRDLVGFENKTKLSFEDYGYSTSRQMFIKKIKDSDKLMKELKRIKPIFNWSLETHDWIADIFFKKLEGSK